MYTTLSNETFVVAGADPAEAIYVRICKIGGIEEITTWYYSSER